MHLHEIILRSSSVHEPCKSRVLIYKRSIALKKGEVFSIVFNLQLFTTFRLAQSIKEIAAYSVAHCSISVR